MQFAERKAPAADIINFSEAEKKAARERFNAELVDRNNNRSVFNAAILCILESAVRRNDAEYIAEKLIGVGLDNPQAIVKRQKYLRDIIYPIRWYNARTKRIVGFSQWWAERGNPPFIINEIARADRDETSTTIMLRDLLASEAPGMQRKTASVFMIRLGYENLVPVDMHVCKLLRTIEPDVAMPDYVKQHPPVGEEYTSCEVRLMKMAESVGLTPAVFHHVVLNRSGREERGWDALHASIYNQGSDRPSCAKL